MLKKKLEKTYDLLALEYQSIISPEQSAAIDSVVKKAQNDLSGK